MNSYYKNSGRTCARVGKVQLAKNTVLNIGDVLIYYYYYYYHYYYYYYYYYYSLYRLCDLVVRVPGYRSRGLGFESGLYQVFWEVVGLERGLQPREYN
jgi:hypothetical protein